MTKNCREAWTEYWDAKGDVLLYCECEEIAESSYEVGWNASCEDVAPELNRLREQNRIMREALARFIRYMDSTGENDNTEELLECEQQIRDALDKVKEVEK